MLGIAHIFSGILSVYYHIIVVIITFVPHGRFFM